MTTVRIPEPIDFSLSGGYLKVDIPCPSCGQRNVLLHIEGPTSPVKPVRVCTHIRAHVVEEGVSYFEFEKVAAVPRRRLALTVPGPRTRDTSANEQPVCQSHSPRGVLRS